MVFLLKITRNLVTTSGLMVKKVSRYRNPGLGNQVKNIEDAYEVIESDPEGFAGLESDLFDAHKSHREHEAQLKIEKEKIRHYVVKRKYFHQDPLPNLLTNAEREHIKFLHSSDEEEWTVEKLAESFPANVEIISKILKSPWTPISSKQACAHDARVLENWEKLKKGEFKEKFTGEFYEHLLKFVDGRENIKTLDKDATNYRRSQWQRPVSTEFSSIISSLRPKSTDNKEHIALLKDKSGDKEKNSNIIESDTRLLGYIKRKKAITIDQLKRKQFFKDSILHNNEDLENNNLPQKTETKKENITDIHKVCEKDNSTSSTPEGTDFAEKFATNELVISDSDRKTYEMSETKPRIYIPLKLQQKGKLYRISDCYYDDDGEFLYRVPGMLPFKNDV